MSDQPQQPPCFILPQPVSVPVGLPGQETVYIDPYEADATLPDGLRDFMSEKLGVQADTIDEYQVRVFSDFISQIVSGLEDDRKKKRNESLPWLDYIRACQQVGSNGQSVPIGNCSIATDTPRQLSPKSTGPTVEAAPMPNTTGG